MSARKPSKEITRWSGQRNSSRSPVTLVALHESVGITNAWDLALFCERKGVSYNDLADNDQMIHTVQFNYGAWHLRRGNPRAVGLCLTTPVRGYSHTEWLGPQRAKVEYAAWWVARTCTLLGLPIRHCNHNQIRSALKGNKADGGVITHNDYTLATRDGTHTDPRGFPVDICIQWARDLAGGSSVVPIPTVHKRESNMAPIVLTKSADNAFRGGTMAETKTRVARESVITFGSTYGWTDFIVTALADGKVIGKQKTVRVKNNDSDWFPVPEGARMVTIEGKTEHAGTNPYAFIWVI